MSIQKGLLYVAFCLCIMISTSAHACVISGSVFSEHELNKIEVIFRGELTDYRILKSGGVRLHGNNGNGTSRLVHMDVNLVAMAYAVDETYKGTLPEVVTVYWQGELNGGPSDSMVDFIKRYGKKPVIGLVSAKNIANTEAKASLGEKGEQAYWVLQTPCSGAFILPDAGHSATSFSTPYWQRKEVQSIVEQYDIP